MSAPRTPSARFRDALARRHPEFFRAPVDPAALCVCSRVRVLRNLAGRPFPGAATPAVRADTLRRATDALSRVWGPLDVYRPGETPNAPFHRFYAAMGAFHEEPLTGGPALPEARRATPKRDRRRAAPVPPRCATLNNRNAVILDFCAPGECLSALWKKASACDDALADSLPYAFSPDCGYLLADPHSSGTGMRVACTLHLPVTAMLGMEGALYDALQTAGVALHHELYVPEDPETPAAALFDCFPFRDGLRAEERVIDDFRAVVRHVCAAEAAALDRLRERFPAFLLDRVARSAALLRTAVRARALESLEWLSDLRLASLLGLPGIDSTRNFLRAAYAAVCPAPSPAAPAESPDILRARLLRPFVPPAFPTSFAPAPRAKPRAPKPSPLQPTLPF